MSLGVLLFYFFPQNRIVLVDRGSHSVFRKSFHIIHQIKKFRAELNTSEAREICV